MGDVRRHQENDALVYHVFDCVPLTAFPNWTHAGEHPPHKVDYITRREYLERAFASAQLRNDAPVRLTPSYRVSTPQSIQETYLRLLRAGYKLRH